MSEKRQETDLGTFVILIAMIAAVSFIVYMTGDITTAISIPGILGL